MTYYGVIDVYSDDPQQKQSITESIRNHIPGLRNFLFRRHVLGIADGSEIYWNGLGLLDDENLQFLESLTRDSGVEIATNEHSNSDGILHTVSWAVKDGKRWKILDEKLCIDDIHVAHLAGFALRDDPWSKAMLAKALGKLEREQASYDNVCNLMSVMSVFQKTQIQPSKDDISGWLEVRDFIAEIDVDYYDPDDIAEAVSYIETACLKTMHGNESTPKRYTATI